MGRSVDYLSNASLVAYCNPSFMEDTEDGSEEPSGYFDWQEFRDDIEGQLKEAFPSLSDVKNRWCGRETRIILENNLVEIGISEYCGLVSISILPNNSLDLIPYDLANYWINRIKSRLLSIVKVYNGINRVGTFSNGEGVYENMK